MSILDAFKLTHRRALVTGSSRGIGAAIALALAEAGADVAVHATNDRTAAEAVADQVRALNRRSAVVMADLSADGAATTIFDATLARLGGLDILVSNVAVQIAEPWSNISAEHFTRQVRINWQSAFELIQLAAPAMLERKWGRILTIGSVQEAKPHPQMVVYSALKAAQSLMVRNLAKQFASQGVTVNNLAPGVINTDRSKVRLVDEEYRAKVLANIPAGHLGEPEDCAGAALLLCSDAGRYITGANVFVDGGMSL